jgi:hypothetical protein
MSPGTDAVWLAIGWTMLHFLWAGGLIGVLAAIVLRALRAASPEVRYAVALGALMTLALAPAAIGWRTGVVGRADPPMRVPEVRPMAAVSANPAPPVGVRPAAVVPTEPAGRPVGPAPIASGPSSAPPRS